MRLIVESGSTKADWMLLDNGRSKAFSTIGFNPLFHSKEDVLIALNDHLDLDLIKEDVKEVFFYGAGCSSYESNEIIKSGLELFFKNANVSVDHDLLAAAISLYEGEPIISCILGTGSNACYFDGREIKEKRPALGYILGDEGSGSYFGKKIITDFLYDRLPEKMSKEFRDLGTTYSSIQERVYSRPNANVFIASHMPIIIRNKETAYCKQLINEGFKDFLRTHVLCFDLCKDVKISFVGSVASLLQDELQEACEQLGLELGKTVRRPLENLVRYHKENPSVENETLAININRN